MKGLLQWLGSAIVALSIGTMTTLLVLTAVLWWKGTLSDERMMGMLAVLQGVKPVVPEDPKAALNAEAELPSLNQIVQARVRTSLDLELRESAIDKALGELRTIETQIKTERYRLDLWKQTFDQRLATMETAANDAAILEVQRTFEAINPKQAKEQILRMLEDPPTADDDPMQDIVMIFKAMPLDKRKKIIAEFKTPEETESLAEILHEIRLGTPDNELIRDSRRQLQQPLDSQRQ